MPGYHIIITSDPNFNEFRTDMFLNHLKYGIETVEYHERFRTDNFGTF